MGEMMMDHCTKKWLVGHDEFGLPCIQTDEFEPWFVAKGTGGLPNDKTGERTLEYICKLHNESLPKAERTQ